MDLGTAAYVGRLASAYDETRRKRAWLTRDAVDASTVTVWGHPLPEDVRDAARDAIRDLVREHLTAHLESLGRDLRDLGVTPES
ncbi:hypothetical protein [Methylobacterium sp. MA0201]|uniref:hypothetical protein n=1 Tax=Methylobacterium alsaeris TaxID=3344826 RepID=UPI0037583373